MKKVLKMGILFIRKVYILLFTPIVLLVHMVSPLLLIRTGGIYSQRIGHLGLDLELSVCHDKSRKQNSRFPKIIDVFYLKGPISNPYLLHLWREKLVILPKWILYPVQVLNQQLPSYAKYNYFDWVEKTGHKDFSLFDRYPPTLAIPLRDLERGEKLLKELGIAKNQPYICLAVRDSAYLQGQKKGKIDWSYHDYRDSEIGNYLAMAEYLAGKGFVVLRMGEIVKTTFNSKNPNVIDYANSKLQSDFADVFLFSTCSFCISTSTGMDAIASIFRVPTGLVNIANINSVASGELVKIFQPKQFVDQQTGRALTYQEKLEGNLFTIDRTSDFARNGINLIENTPEELRLFAEELLGILTLERVPRSTRDEIRQISMRGIVKKERIDKLSRSWLRNHQYYMK